MEYSLGSEIVTDPYNIAVIRTSLNRNLAACYPNIQDEVVQSFKDVLSLDGDGEPRTIRLHRPLTCLCDICTEWKAVPAMKTVLRIVCTVSNRFFVGLPLCTSQAGTHDKMADGYMCTGRDPDYLDMSMTFTVDVMKTAIVVNLTPKFLQP